MCLSVLVWDSVGVGYTAGVSGASAVHVVNTLVRYYSCMYTHIPACMYLCTWVPCMHI